MVFYPRYSRAGFAGLPFTRGDEFIFASKARDKNGQHLGTSQQPEIGHLTSRKHKDGKRGLVATTSASNGACSFNETHYHQRIMKRMNHVLLDGAGD